MASWKVMRHCGHRTSEANYEVVATMEWCETCKRYVGVTVTKQEK